MASIKSNESDNEIQTENIKRSLELCKKITDDVIVHLIELKREIDSHRKKVLAAKTSGTTATTLGTGMAVTGLIMAPFTLGTSLIVSSVGAVTTVCGAFANLITDLVDRSKTKKFIQNIQDLADEQQKSKEELIIVLDVFTVILESLMDKGLTQTQAMYAAIHGDRCADDTKDLDDPRAEGFEWVDTPDGKWTPIRKFCFKAGFTSIKLVKNSKTLALLAAGGNNFANMTTGGAAFGAGARAASTGISTTSSVAAGIGRVLGSAAFRVTMASVGVVFTAIDIALLAKQWKNTDPTSETVQVVIDEFNEEIKHYEDLMSKLIKIEQCKMFAIWFEDDAFPIVGISPFAVETLFSICNQDLDRARTLYGDAPGITSDDARLAVLSIVYSQGLNVGPLSYESVQEAIDRNINKMKEIKETLESDDEDSEEIDTQNKKQKRAAPIVSISELFDEKDLEAESAKVFVFNQEVTKVYQEIIDSFLEKHKYPIFEDLKNFLNNTTVLNDYFQPLSANVIHLIRDVLISYHKYGGYLNANKWEYNLTWELLKPNAVTVLHEEFYKIEANKSIEDWDENSVSLDSLNDLVEVLVNHKSFIDPVAAAIWTIGNENTNGSDIYNTAMDSVQNLFKNLQFKIPVWACEIHSAVQMYNQQFKTKS